MKFMILIHSNPRSREIWNGFTQAQKAEGLDYYAALAADLDRSGELIATEALADPSQGRRAGGAIATDGPFAEAKEVLGGYALMKAASKEEMVKHTRRFLEVVGQGTCEIYQLYELPERN